jgi:hypothetical protein
MTERDIIAGADLCKLVMEIDGVRYVYVAPVPEGKDPMEMTLGEWKRAAALSGAGLFDDFLSRRALRESGG